MKKTIIAVSAMFVSLCGYGQLLDVAAVQRVTVPSGYHVEQANISPDGRFAVVSSLAGPGLVKLDLATGDAKPISEKGSNIDLKFTADGKNAVFREINFDNKHRRQVAVKSVDLNTGRQTTLVKPSRDIQAISIDGAMAVAVDKGRAKVHKLGNAAAVAERPVLSIDHGALHITRNGVTTDFSPLGTAGKSYIWQSVSPDGTKALFYVVGEGCYTCNIDGTGVHSLGILRAPVWYDNNTVVGMVNVNDEVRIVESRIEAVSADGTVRQRLTPADVVATFPSASPRKISFTTPAGELYLINLK